MKRTISKIKVADFLRRNRLQLISVFAAALLLVVIVRNSDGSVKFVGFSGLLRARADEAAADFINRGGYHSPQQLCDLSEESIKKMLKTPHNCRRGGERVYMEGEWRTAEDMRMSLKPPHTKSNQPVACAVFCAENESPCADHKCLFPVHMRRNSTDPVVTALLLDKGEYDFVRPNMEHKTILDAGANCGVASIVFALMFPEATIVSVEPSKGNYNIMRQNTRIFRNVIPVHAALWNKVTMLAMTKGQRTPNALEWGFMVQPKGDVPEGREIIDTMQAVSVPFLLDFFGLTNFDMLKIDIEGSEKEVMTKSSDNDLSWLDSAKMAMFETHDDMRKGSERAVGQAFWDRADTWRYSHRHSEYFVYKRHGFDEELDPPSKHNTTEKDNKPTKKEEKGVGVVQDKGTKN